MNLDKFFWNQPHSKRIKSTHFPRGGSDVGWKGDFRVWSCMWLLWWAPVYANLEGRSKYKNSDRVKHGQIVSGLIMCANHHKSIKFDQYMFLSNPEASSAVLSKQQLQTFMITPPNRFRHLGMTPRIPARMSGLAEATSEILIGKLQAGRRKKMTHSDNIGWGWNRTELLLTHPNYESLSACLRNMEKVVAQPHSCLGRQSWWSQIESLMVKAL